MRTYQDEQQDPCCLPKRVLRARNLRVRTLDALVKTRPAHPRPLTLRFLSGPVHALQKSTPRRSGSTFVSCLFTCWH